MGQEIGSPDKRLLLSFLREKVVVWTRVVTVGVKQHGQAGCVWEVKLMGLMGFDVCK